MDDENSIDVQTGAWKKNRFTLQAYDYINV